MDQCEKIVELAEENNAIDSLVADPAVIWKSRKAYLEADRARSLVFSMEDIVVPMTEIPDAVQQISRLSEKYNVAMHCAGHCGDGNVHIDILKDDRTQEEWEEMLPKIQGEIYALGFVSLPMRSPNILRMASSVSPRIFGRKSPAYSLCK